MIFSKPLPFPRRRLAALIGTSVLLHACSTLTEPDRDSTVHGSQGPDESSRTTAVLGREHQQRAMGVPHRGSHGDIIPSLEDQVITDLWQRLRLGFHFALQHDNEHVRDALDAYASTPDYIQRVSENAQPFIYLVIDAVEQRGLPMELALLPIVESAYNPNAVSHQSAVGLWQFMPATATGMGLKRDWWYDGRRDPVASTVAALDYLESLYRIFDEDWLLALAAYNVGQGNLQRAIRRNEANGEPTDFWSLQLPRETTQHVPRILALAHLMNDPEAFNIEPTPLPNEPYVTVIDAGSQIDLTLVASLAGLEPEIVYRLNPGYRQWATHPDGPHTLLLPLSHADRLSDGLASLSEQQRVTWDRYEIQPGDTLGTIANRYRTRVAILQQVNDLSDSRIVAGRSLLIPRAYNTNAPLEAPNAPIYDETDGTRLTAASYRVRSGDSLWRIATEHRIDMQELARWNNISLDAVLQPGQTLRLQPAEAIAAQGSDAGGGASSLKYQVRPGDSLSRIARQHGLQVSEIAQWNDIGEEDTIYPGQQLLLPISSN